MLVCLSMGKWKKPCPNNEKISKYNLKHDNWSNNTVSKNILSKIKADECYNEKGMTRIYIRISVTKISNPKVKQQQYVPLGWYCPDCKYFEVEK